jgi:hypothetical protein
LVNLESKLIKKQTSSLPLDILYFLNAAAGRLLYLSLSLTHTQNTGLSPMQELVEEHQLNAPWFAADHKGQSAPYKRNHIIRGVHVRVYMEQSKRITKWQLTSGFIRVWQVLQVYIYEVTLYPLHAILL